MMTTGASTERELATEITTTHGHWAAVPGTNGKDRTGTGEIAITIPVTCPARLTGVDKVTIGVVLDFVEVREALGLPRVSVDQGDMDYDAAAEYHRLNKANRLFVNETRPMERSDPAEAVARYRRRSAPCRSAASWRGRRDSRFMALR